MGCPLPKVIHMPKRNPAQAPDSGAPSSHSPLLPIVPDADEEQASVDEIKKWVSLADAALADATHKRA